jgi:hypothetical protein
MTSPVGVASSSGPLHLALATQTWVPRSQRASWSQSLSCVHAVAQTSASQANGAQTLVLGAGQVPEPSQRASATAIPSLHAAGRQTTLVPTKLAQVDRSVPSHVEAPQGSAAEPLEHAGRLP